MPRRAPSPQAPSLLRPQASRRVHFAPPADSVQASPSQAQLDTNARGSSPPLSVLTNLAQVAAPFPSATGQMPEDPGLAERWLRNSRPHLQYASAAGGTSLRAFLKPCYSYTCSEARRGTGGGRRAAARAGGLRGVWCGGDSRLSRSPWR
jgi:hypothetical protein